MIDRLRFESKKISPARSSGIDHCRNPRLQCKSIRWQRRVAVAQVGVGFGAKKMVTMDVDQPGGNIQPRRIDHLLCLLDDLRRNFHNFLVADGNVQNGIDTAFWINEWSVLDQDINGLTVDGEGSETECANKKK